MKITRCFAVTAGAAVLSWAFAARADAASHAIHNPATAAFAVDQLQARTGLPASEFESWKTLYDPQVGKSHVRLTRSYKGLPVTGGDVVVHLDADGTYLGMSGRATRLDMDVTPKVSADRVVSIAAAKLGKAGSPTSELKIWITEDGTAHLAWQVVLSDLSGSEPYKHTYIVDAKTGNVVLDFDSLETLNGTGRGYHNGNVTITITRSGARYYLRDLTARNFDTANDLGYIFSSTTRTFGNGSYTTTSTNGADVHYGLMKTWDYYEDTFGRSSYDGAGTYFPAFVYRYGTGYVNAYWATGDGYLVFGDGSIDDGYYPLTSLDVVGHEFSHGVCETSVPGGLRYVRQSGGINEGNSDIFGTMVECYAGNASDPCDWTIGEKVVSPYLRNMSDPPADGASIDNFSDYTDGLDVHYSSGIVNKFFYLLSDDAVYGIGSDAAAAIWYQALTNYFVNAETFADARTDTLQAAQDLYGAASAEYSAVGDAWDDVGLH
ncbi:MAG: M4 family metallopeptidase [Acidobacteria bacterium]|nr:M4 family metallopeptidase [Acidobacteriota bacterium]